MSIDAAKSRITGRIWQSIQESGVDVSAIPTDQLRRLVDAIADGMLIEFNGMLDEAVPQAAVGQALGGALSTGGAAAPPAEEIVLWAGRPFLSLTERYIVTTQRVRIISGLLAKDHEDIEMIRLRDVDHSQGIGERMLNIGDVQLHSTDATRPAAVLRNVPNPENVHEIIRRAMLNARRQYPFIVEQNL